MKLTIQTPEAASLNLTTSYESRLWNAGFMHFFLQWYIAEFLISMVPKKRTKRPKKYYLSFNLSSIM